MKFKKGHKGYWLSKKKPHSNITKQKISESLLGHVVSEETRNKIKEKSIFKKGFTPWNKNRKWPEEMKKKISETNKRKGIEPKIKFKAKAEKNPKWNGGNERFWKNKALIRDDYTCQICGYREPFIMEVDHIKQKSKFPELARELNNLLTLCPNCHRRKTKREEKNIW